MSRILRNGQRHLWELVTERGLTTRLHAKSSSKPISLSHLNRILGNRYYLGYVTYCGVEYQGNHQPLITPSVFAAVQAVRALHRAGGSRKHRHFHYLKGLLACARCGRNLCFTIATGKREKYDYFFCIKNPKSRCSQHYIPTPDIERAVIQALGKRTFSPKEQEEIAGGIAQELETELQAVEMDIKHQNKRLTRLQAEQEQLFQALYGSLLEPRLVKIEQKRISTNTEQAQRVIVQAEKRRQTIVSRRDRALALARTLDLTAAFERANPIIRQYFCKALFSKAVIDDRTVGCSLQSRNAP